MQLLAAAPDRSRRREEAIRYLGIDVGGSKVALRVAGDTGGEPDGGRAEETFRWPAAGDVTADMDLLAARVRGLLGRGGEPLAGVGVAMPAICDAAGTVRTWPGRPSWVGLDLTAAFGKLLPGIPVACADDGDLAALAEAHAAGRRNLLYVGVGTGIGGGIVHEGRSWPGPGRGSCEVGHVVVDRSGPRCDCGRTGCVQAVASGPATLRRAAELRGRMTGFEELVAGARLHAPWAETAVDESAAAVAAAVTGVCELAHPELVLVGGGFAAGVPGYVASVTAHVERLARPGTDPVRVRPAVLGGRSSLQGAVLLARETHRRGAEPPDGGVSFDGVTGRTVLRSD
ncbi:ROK family protein [Streptomyces sp. NPDC051162]|uniref:ROK family protein n=1 Tax=unclassified Streptomyces TaxID=2593676 RepID=UPI00341C5175